MTPLDVVQMSAMALAGLLARHNAALTIARAGRTWYVVFARDDVAIASASGGLLTEAISSAINQLEAL